MAYSKTQLNRIAKGQCIQCADPSKGKKRCDKCQKKSTDNLRKWRVGKTEKTRAYGRKWRTSHLEQARTADRKRYAADPDKRQVYTRRWRITHRHVLREYGSRYKAKLRALKPPRTIMTPDERKASQRAAQIRWQQRNPEKVLQYQRRALEKLNADEARKAKKYAYVRSYHKANPERVKALRDRWMKEHPERAKEIARLKRIRHRDRIRVSQKRWRDANREHVRLVVREYAKRNKDRFNALRNKRYHENLQESRTKCQLARNRRRNVPGTHTVKQWLARVEYFGWKCVWCGAALTRKTLTKDHVIAITKGGTDWPSNLVPACCSCNSSKNNKHHKEWRRRSQ